MESAVLKTHIPGGRESPCLSAAVETCEPSFSEVFDGLKAHITLSIGCIGIFVPAGKALRRPFTTAPGKKERGKQPLGHGNGGVLEKTDSGSA